MKNFAKEAWVWVLVACSTARCPRFRHCCDNLLFELRFAGEGLGSDVVVQDQQWYKQAHEDRQCHQGQIALHMRSRHRELVGRFPGGQRV